MAKLKPIVVEIYKHEKHKDVLKCLADNMREIELFEARSIGFNDPQEAVNVSFEMAAIAYIVKTKDGDVLCGFGISQLASDDYGSAIWLIGTPKMDEYQHELVLHSKVVVNAWKEKYKRLFNILSVENKKSIRWLASLGAEFSEEIDVGGHPFKIFTIKSGD